MRNWKKEKEGRQIQRSVVYRGILTVMLMTALLASKTLTVAGRGKNKIPSLQEQIRVTDQSQRYPIFSGAPDGELEDYIIKSHYTPNDF